MAAVLIVVGNTIEDVMPYRSRLNLDLGGDERIVIELVRLFSVGE
ncbi:hypothetical protein [Vibrio kasasachensis]